MSQPLATWLACFVLLGCIRQQATALQHEGDVTGYVGSRDGVTVGFELLCQTYGEGF